LSRKKQPFTISWNTTWPPPDGDRSYISGNGAGPVVWEYISWLALIFLQADEFVFVAGYKPYLRFR